jgi:uncharacterized alpha/beta hydrolase family protein
MKRLFILLVLIAAVTVGLGFYLGWFTLTTQTTADGKQNVTVTVDKDKIKAAEQKAKDKAKDLGNEAREKAAQQINK